MNTSGGGFSFGQTSGSGQSSQQTNSMFNLNPFGSQQTTQPFSFGTQTTQSLPQMTNTNTNAFTFQPFNSSAATTVPQFGSTQSAFSLNPSTTSSQPFSFGQFGSQQTTTPSLFGQQLQQQRPQQQFNFMNQMNPISQPTQTSQPSLFGTQPTPQPTNTLSFGSTPGFGTSFASQPFGSSTQTMGSITPSAPVSSAPNLFGAQNIPISSAPSSVTPAFGGFSGGFAPNTSTPGFNFGVSTPTTTTSTLSYSLSSAPVSISTSAPSATVGTTSAFGLSGSSSGFGFGTASTPVTTTSVMPTLSFPAVTQTATVAPFSSIPSITPAVTSVATTTASVAFNFSVPNTSSLNLSTSTNPSTTATVSPFSMSTPLTTTTTTIAPTFTLSTTASSAFPTKTTTFSLTPTTTITSAAVTTAQSIPTTTPTRMTFRQLEDQINIWLNELNQLETEFHIQAQTINSWDSLLINNGLKITQINETLEKLRTDHTRLDHQLDFIIAQQNELEQLLIPIENTKFEMSTNNAVNAEREYTYSMVETVHNDLNSIGSDLKNFIKKLNDMRTNDDSSEPLAQIAKILNSHMDALQWIENQIKTIKIS